MKFLTKAKRVTDNLELDLNSKILSLEDLLDTQLQLMMFTLPVEQADRSRPQGGTREAASEASKWDNKLRSLDYFFIFK